MGGRSTRHIKGLGILTTQVQVQAQEAFAGAIPGKTVTSKPQLAASRWMGVHFRRSELRTSDLWPWVPSSLSMMK